MAGLPSNGEEPNIIKDLCQRKLNGCNTSARAECHWNTEANKTYENAPVLIGANLEKTRKPATHWYTTQYKGHNDIDK